jgi:nucleoside-diphosphate-sugar epimerase
MNYLLFLLIFTFIVQLDAKILVLGSGGLIGKSLIEWLHTNQYEYTQVINRQHIDLRISNSLDHFTNITFVYFLACEVGGSKYINSMSDDIQIHILQHNILIYQNVFTWIQRHNIPFIFTSSYLHSQESAYGSIKRLGEQWIKFMINKDDLQPLGKIARLWNIYGYEHIGLKSHIIGDWITACLNTGQIISLTNGDEPRQFLHVDDTSNALGLMMKNFKTINFVTDLSSSQWITMKQLGHIITSMSPKICLVTYSSNKASMMELISPNTNHSFYLEWNPRKKLTEEIQILYTKYSQNSFSNCEASL